MDSKSYLESIYIWVDNIFEKLDFENEYTVCGCLDLISGTVTENAKSIAISAGFEYDLENGVVINSGSAPKLASFALNFISAFDCKNVSYPLIFNQSRTDGLIIEYGDDDHFLIVNFLKVTPNNEMCQLLLDKTKKIEDLSFLTFDALLLLVNCYEETGELSLAISDWAFILEHDEFLLSDYNVSSSLIIQYPVIEAPKQLGLLLGDNRLDALSYRILFNACGRK